MEDEKRSQTDSDGPRWENAPVVKLDLMCYFRDCWWKPDYTLLHCISHHQQRRRISISHWREDELNGARTARSSLVRAQSERELKAAALCLWQLTCEESCEWQQWWEHTLAKQFHRDPAQSELSRFVVGARAKGVYWFVTLNIDNLITADRTRDGRVNT